VLAASIHRRNQKEVNEPTDAKQAKRKKVNCTADRPTVVKAVSPGETEDPGQIAN